MVTHTGSVVNQDLTLKAKAKDLTFKAKELTLKTEAKDLAVKAKHSKLVLEDSVLKAKNQDQGQQHCWYVTRHQVKPAQWLK